MWSFDSWDTEFVKSKDFNFYLYKGFQFRLETFEKERLVEVKIFHEQKYIDNFYFHFEENDFSITRRHFLLRQEMESLIDFFYNYKFLFIKKRIYLKKENSYCLWMVCYNNKLEKTFSNEMKYRNVTYIQSLNYTNFFYITEIVNDNFIISWPQYNVSESWIEKINDIWSKAFWITNFYSQIKKLKKIHEKGLYTLYQDPEKDHNYSWRNLFWTVIVLIKELIEFTQSFFWNDYEVDLWELIKNNFADDEETREFATSYTLYLKVTKKENTSFLWIGNIFKEQKFKNYQKKVLSKFPQLLKTHFFTRIENIDLEKRYCSFYLRVEKDWELANLRDIEDFVYYRDDYYDNSPFQPLFLTSYTNYENSLLRFFQTGIISSKELYKLEKLKIFYDIFSNKDSFIRKRAKYFLENKNEEIQENNLFLYQIDILKEKYGDWNYVLNYKNDQKINFLRENWELLYSFPLKDINPWNILIYYFNQVEWSICLKWSLDNYILLDLLNFESSVISFFPNKKEKVILNNSWCNDTLYDLNNPYSPLFRLFKKEIGSSFEYNYNKLSSWKIIYKNSRNHFFHIWVRGYFKLEKMFLGVNYSWSNDIGIYQQRVLDFYFYEFLSNKKLNMYYHLFAKGKDNFIENIQIYNSTILKNNHKLGIIIPWKYLWR